MDFSINELEQKKLNKSLLALESNIETFRKIMRCFDLYTSKKHLNITNVELQEFSKVILDHVPFMISVLENTFVTRGRKNTGQLFFSKQELSYNKNLNNIQQGRFNLPKQSVFYGSLPTFRVNGEYIDYENQCPLFEICKELNTHSKLVFPVFITLGFWKISKPIYVLNLCYDDKHLVENGNLKVPFVELINFIKGKCSIDVFNFILDVWKYFSELSRKWDEDICSNYYDVLTAFYNALSENYREVYQKEIDGIIYPSAMTQAKGLNIVINTQTVDNNLDLINVQMYTLKSRSLQFDYEPITPIVSVKNSLFEFDTNFVKKYNLFNNNWPH